MSFCERKEITSDAEMNAPFPPRGSTDKTIFPTQGLSRDGDGRLSTSALQIIYDALISQKRLVSGDEFRVKLNEIKTKQASESKEKGRDEVKRILDELPNMELQTMNGLKNEFCYTYIRYKYALDRLFTKLTQTSKAGKVSEADKRDVTMYLGKAKEFNIKLNDLIQVSNFIASKRVNDASKQSAEVNALNSSISSTFASLQEHQKMLNKENAEADLRQRMVEYTKEKNKSTNNWLQLYGVLNIAAIGLLLYIYRS
jgi:hypothetical protein